MRQRTSAVLGGLVLLAGCASTTEAGEATDDSSMAGMGVPQQFPSETFPGVRRQLQVRVHLARNGCFLGVLPGGGERYLVVWPADTEQEPSGDQLRLPDGTVVGDEDELTARAALLATSDLAGFGEDSYWDFSVGFCTPRASEVLVVDSVTSA